MNRLIDSFVVVNEYNILNILLQLGDFSIYRKVDNLILYWKFMPTKSGRF